MLRNLLAFLVFTVPIATVEGQERARQKPADESAVEQPKANAAASLKSTVYVVNHVPARDLAGIVNQMLLGRGEARVASESVSNCLLISAPSEAHDEIRRVLVQLDVPVPRVAIDAEIAQVTWADTGKSVGESPAGTRDDAHVDLSKSSREVVARLRQLEQKGQMEVLNRISLATLSNQPAFFNMGGRRTVSRSSAGQRGSSSSPSAASRGFDPNDPSAAFGGSRVSTSIESTGTILGVTARVSSDGVITLSVDMEKSFFSPRADDPTTAGLTTAMLQSTVSLRDGETVVLGGFGSSSKPSQSQLVMLLTARIAPREAGGTK